MSKLVPIENKEGLNSAHNINLCFEYQDTHHLNKAKDKIGMQYCLKSINYFKSMSNYRYLNPKDPLHFTCTDISILI